MFRPRILAFLAIFRPVKVCNSSRMHYDVMIGAFLKRTFRSYSIVKPGYVKEMRTVPEHINSPVYYKTGKPPKSSKEIEIKTKEQIEKMRAAGQLARFILDEVGIKIRVGMTTDKIDEIVHNMAIEHGAYPSPLNYEGFPKSVCTSVNNVACHGIPDDRPLQDGDIINVDVTYSVSVLCIDGTASAVIKEWKELINYMYNQTV